jgi:sterol desaturase/sphingolipid hydroxylase (fatty acid hydroxylase superfamily)
MNSLREQWLLLVSTPVYIIIIGLEILLIHFHFKRTFNWKDSLASLYLMILNSVIDLAFRIIYLAVLQFFFVHALITWQESLLYWMGLLLAEDFLYYWLHRFDHQVRLFWAVHVTHHSSEHMNLTVGFRSSVFQPLYRFIYFIPLALFGFKPIDIAFIYSLTQIWGILVHTETIKKMGWLEYILVTPSHHRVHHASNPKYLDKNMGMLLIIWDKLFGTFQPEMKDDEYQPMKYGLTSNVKNPNALNLVFHEWQNIRKDFYRKDLSFRQKLNYLIKPPGWSHDGSRFTSDELRLKEKKGNAS